jgi:hypothetical protein
MDCQFNTKPSEKDHDLPGIQTRDLWISSQHCLQLHHLGRLKDSSHVQRKTRRVVGCTDWSPTELYHFANSVHASIKLRVAYFR